MEEQGHLRSWHPGARTANADIRSGSFPDTRLQALSRPPWPPTSVVAASCACPADTHAIAIRGSGVARLPQSPTLKLPEGRPHFIGLVQALLSLFTTVTLVSHAIGPPYTIRTRHLRLRRPLRPKADSTDARLLSVAGQLTRGLSIPSLRSRGAGLR